MVMGSFWMDTVYARPWWQGTLYTVQMEVHAVEFTAVTVQRCVFNSSSKSRKFIYFQITFQELLLMFQLKHLPVVVKVDVKKM